jgi:hypothetical protein
MAFRLPAALGPASVMLASDDSTGSCGCRSYPVVLMHSGPIPGGRCQVSPAGALYPRARSRVVHGRSSLVPVPVNRGGDIRRGRPSQVRLRGRCPHRAHQGWTQAQLGGLPQVSAKACDRLRRPMGWVIPLPSN